MVQCLTLAAIKGNNLVKTLDMELTTGLFMRYVARRKVGDCGTPHSVAFFYDSLLYHCLGCSMRSVYTHGIRKRSKRYLGFSPTRGPRLGVSPI